MADGTFLKISEENYNFIVMKNYEALTERGELTQLIAEIAVIHKELIELYDEFGSQLPEQEEY